MRLWLTELVGADLHQNLFVAAVGDFYGLYLSVSGQFGFVVGSLSRQ